MCGTFLLERTLEPSGDPGRALWTFMMCAWSVSPRRTPGESTRTGGHGRSTALCMLTLGQRCRSTLLFPAAPRSWRAHSSTAMMLHSSEVVEPDTNLQGCSVQEYQ